MIWRFVSANVTGLQLSKDTHIQVIQTDWTMNFVTPSHQLKYFAYKGKMPLSHHQLLINAENIPSWKQDPPIIQVYFAPVHALLMLPYQ